ncbi:MAG: pyridoxamine 5'-phosphate oxidase family protein [Alphaproteobacteria bacterium]|nr:pyridoxamine 5'-phosphate oxidase family protein [Alphaproteobacteria bacterium]MDP6567313.1 pyridoxamine 5'-phosphate oxidase family protein [Alphaproteobacteria bacterium]MDP6811904.1 pyridoxamine 5'-phosphate oxidase family protein [Alphaproteobacteria bacterium]
MNRSEREAFLAEVRVAMLCLTEAGRGPLVAPVWYDYRPGGDLWFLTQSTSRKGRLIAPGGRLTLAVQIDAPPYQYVSVEGPVIAVEPYDLDADLLPMAQRYLGGQGGIDYVEGSRPTHDPAKSVKVTVRPERWLSADYKKRA